MKVVIHNLLKDTNKVYEGDATTVERAIEEDYPWAVHHYYGDLDKILYTIDHHPFFGVEIEDSSLHPFLKD